MTTRISREEKKLLAKKNNLDSLAAAINALENIRANYYYKVNRNSKTKINELLAILKQEDQKISLSVRAAKAISMLTV